MASVKNSLCECECSAGFGLELMDVLDVCEALWRAGMKERVADVTVCFWFDSVDEVD